MGPLGARRRFLDEPPAVLAHNGAPFYSSRKVSAAQRSSKSRSRLWLWFWRLVSFAIILVTIMAFLLPITGFDHFKTFNNDSWFELRGVSKAEQPRLLASAAKYTSSSGDVLLSKLAATSAAASADQQTLNQKLDNNDNTTQTSTSHWAKPSGDYVMDTSDLWEQKDLRQEIPYWMIQYFRFHKEQRQLETQLLLQEGMQPQPRYLYVTCLAEYRKCGGTADRLLPLPFLVLVAASSRRILLIHWTQPAALEQFLMPPTGGLDWRVHNTPTSTWFQTHSEKAGDEASIVELAHRTSVAVVQVKFQSHDHGAGYYNRHCVVQLQPALANDNETRTLEPDFDTVFAGLWRVVFTPSLTLAQQIQATIRQPAQLLAPGQYVAAHVRALYGVSSRPDAVIARVAENAMTCSAQFMKDDNVYNPVVYVASDSLFAVHSARNFGTTHGLTVVSAATANTHTSHQQQQEPLHLDKTPNWRQRPATDFMNVFVDLYLLGSSRCVTYGMGGFGPLASLISRTGAATCHGVHMNATVLADCPPVPSSLSSYSLRKQQSAEKVDPTRHAQLWSTVFLPPMNSPNKF